MPVRVCMGIDEFDRTVTLYLQAEPGAQELVLGLVLYPQLAQLGQQGLARSRIFDPHQAVVSKEEDQLAGRNPPVQGRKVILSRPQHNHQMGRSLTEYTGSGHRVFHSTVVSACHPGLMTRLDECSFDLTHGHML